jgi:hypothetical protein
MLEHEYSADSLTCLNDDGNSNEVNDGRSTRKKFTVEHHEENSLREKNRYRISQYDFMSGLTGVHILL